MPGVHPAGTIIEVCLERQLTLTSSLSLGQPKNVQ